MELKINTIYKHFKGDLYLIVDFGYDSNTLEEVVIYRALYKDNKLWVRPKSEFLEEVNRNGQKYRFEEYIIESKKEREI